MPWPIGLRAQNLELSRALAEGRYIALDAQETLSKIVARSTHDFGRFMAPRILIVDDHQIVRQGVRTLLAEFRPAWEICGEAANAEEALQAVKDLQPDLAVLDITMPGGSGLELSSQIRALGYTCGILIFTMHHSSRLGSDVRAVGAQGFVLKSQAARNLVFAIERILDGGTFYGSEEEGGGGSDPKPSRNISFSCHLALAAI